eukprot:g65381.t1
MPQKLIAPGCFFVALFKKALVFCLYGLMCGGSFGLCYPHFVERMSFVRAKWEADASILGQDLLKIVLSEMSTSALYETVATSFHGGANTVEPYEDAGLSKSLSGPGGTGLAKGTLDFDKDTCIAEGYFWCPMRRTCVPERSSCPQHHKSYPPSTRTDPRNSPSTVDRHFSAAQILLDKQQALTGRRLCNCIQQFTVLQGSLHAKGLGSMLKALFHDQHAKCFLPRTKPLGFQPALQAAMACAGQLLNQSAPDMDQSDQADQSADPPRVLLEMGGGSGAGFQLYCRQNLLLSVGGGGGGGLAVEETGEFSVGGGRGGGLQFLVPFLGVVQVGGGGGGGFNGCFVQGGPCTSQQNGSPEQQVAPPATFEESRQQPGWPDVLFRTATDVEMCQLEPCVLPDNPARVMLQPTRHIPHSDILLDPAHPTYPALLAKLKAVVQTCAKEGDLRLVGGGGGGGGGSVSFRAHARRQDSAGEEQWQRVMCTGGGWGFGISARQHVPDEQDEDRQRRRSDDGNHLDPYHFTIEDYMPSNGTASENLEHVVQGLFNDALTVCPDGWRDWSCMCQHVKTVSSKLPPESMPWSLKFLYCPVGKLPTNHESQNRQFL